MKKLFVLLFFLGGSLYFLSGSISCKKDSRPKIDERDTVTGTYSGIEISRNSEEPPFYDTVPILVKIRKSDQDSIVCYNYKDDNCYLSFKYHNYIFISTLGYHPPSLKFVHDSIYFFYQPGLGPYYSDDRCKRISRSD